MFKHLSISFKVKKEEIKINDNLMLIANGRIKYLLTKLKIDIDKTTYFNINQPINNIDDNIYQYLSFFDYIKAYIYSLIGSFLVIVKLKDKTDILQNYIAYEWFLTYIVLKKINKHTKKVYFANHYDRWATMFDQIFADKELVLIQHGILPE
ncbi:MAG: hypothetical protein QM490_00245, partial [Candidatus Gracilibacteria bacterium]